MKYSQFDREQNESLRAKKPYAAENLSYDAARDVYYCPTGKPMKKIDTKTTHTQNGFEQTIAFYQAKKCEGCPLRGECHGQQGNRIIKINHNLNRLKRQADKRLKTKRGILKRKQRCFDTEPVFGDIKYNHHFKRFMLRGLDKVNVETGLLALAHNLRKKIAA